MKRKSKILYIALGISLAVICTAFILFLIYGDKKNLKTVASRVLPFIEGTGTSGADKELEDVPMPGIAFAYNTTQADIMFISSDGRIFQAVSKEAFHASGNEVVRKIQENDYADILVCLGKIDNEQVQKMYNLFSDVVLNGEYLLNDVYDYSLNSVSVDRVSDIHFKNASVVEYWYGYRVEEGEVRSRCIYESNKDLVCSDERAYIIVDWISDIVKKYKKTEEEIQELKNQEKEERSKAIEWVLDKKKEDTERSGE